MNHNIINEKTNLVCYVTYLSFMPENGRPQWGRFCKMHLKEYEISVRRLGQRAESLLSDNYIG